MFEYHGEVGSLACEWVRMPRARGPLWRSSVTSTSEDPWPTWP